VVAGGTAPLKYQWYFDTNTPISGATNATLSLTNVQSGGTYDVVVSNAYASITTSTAKLTVLPNPPTSLTATSGVNSITLSYPAVANAKFYTIYRSKVSGVSYSKIATTTATKYTDLNVIKGISYYYVVGSCDGVNLSGYSKQATAASH
jgi:fibronectin type 3 domain-containing protein